MKSTLLTTALIGSSLLALPAATLQHLWDFETGFADQVGSADGTPGTEVTTVTGHDGGTAMFAPGTLSGGGAFNSDGYVGIDNTQTISPGTGAFSMTYWIKIADDGTTNARGIFDFGGDGGDGPQSLYIGTNGNLAFRIDGLSGGAAALVPMPEDDQWHFVAANYTPGTGIEVHLDGFGVDGSVAGNFGNVTLDPDQYLGAFNVSTNPARGLDGALDDVRFFSGTLSETEITALYTGVPEPSTGLLGLLGVAALMRRRR